MEVMVLVGIGRNKNIITVRVGIGMAPVTRR
jgi:hypothetical protein